MAHTEQMRAKSAVDPVVVAHAPCGEHLLASLSQPSLGGGTGSVGQKVRP